jgi:hypothetical protein
MIDLKSDDVGGDLWIWKWLEKLLERLGDDGMSSDESDTEGTESVYRVKTMLWRCERIEDYMDLIERQPYVDKEVFRRQGKSCFRRIRGQHNPTTSRKPVARLPHQLYDEEWLEEQTGRYRDSVLKVSREKFQMLDISAANGVGSQI